MTGADMLQSVHDEFAHGTGWRKLLAPLLRTHAGRELRIKAVGNRYRKLLGPLASEYGLVLELETLNPGKTPSQMAFNFVRPGATILSAFREPRCFPSENENTKRRGAKWIRRYFTGDGARQATIFLAQALATLLSELASEANRRADAEISLGIRQLIQEHYPLTSDALSKLEACGAEYRTRGTYEVDPEVAAGVRGASGYHTALLDRDLLDGMHPEEDPELVDAQRRYASSYFQAMAGLTAVELAIGPERHASIGSSLLTPTETSFAALAQRHSIAASWLLAAEEWQRYSQIALSD